MPRRQKMNDQKKLKLSKETLRCLDDDALTDVVGGGGHDRGRGGNVFVSGDCHNTSQGCANFSLACPSDQGNCNISGALLCVVA
jgi:hypothetical protein